MAERDALTNLWTRGTLESELAQNVAEAVESKRPLSLIMVDIDHFKSVNDTHGHQRGDVVLAGVAACISSVAENKGRVYRYGGEELLVVLKNHDVREATAVAERARCQLEAARIEGLAVTASFGVAAVPEHGRTSADIIKAADTALYDAKNRGRNLVRISGEPAPRANEAREPERRLPPPGALSEQQKTHLRQQHFKGYRINCPKDGAVLKVEEMTYVGSTTAQLLVWCKMCGLTEEF